VSADGLRSTHLNRLAVSLTSIWTGEPRTWLLAGGQPAPRMDTIANMSADG
jgi:hypothetical protein